MAPPDFGPVSTCAYYREVHCCSFITFTTLSLINETTQTVIAIRIITFGAKIIIHHNTNEKTSSSNSAIIMEKKPSGARQNVRATNFEEGIKSGNCLPKFVEKVSLNSQISSVN